MAFRSAFTRFRFRAYISVIATGLVIISSCVSNSEPYYILDLDAEDEVSVFSKTQQYYSSVPDKSNNTSIVAEKGDILFLKDDFYFYLRQIDTGKMTFRTDRNLAYLNDKICSVSIPIDEEMIPWFEGVKDYDLSSLNFLTFGSSIPDAYLPYLEETGRTNPGIGLYFEDMEGNAKKVVSYFSPHVILCNRVKNEDIMFLSALPQLEVLTLAFEDTVNNPLPAMPGLKDLSILNVEESIIATPDLLVNNSQIERIVIFSEEFDLSLLKPLKELKNLIVASADTLEDYELLNDFKSVEVFKPGWAEFRYDMVPREMAKLRWVSFNTDATQDDFDKFIESHPGLEVVEINNNSDITDLNALHKLKDLSVLSVGDTLTDIDALLELKNLKLALLPVTVLNDSTRKAELQKSLPDTRLVAQDGVCLGSGWLLLLIPFTLVVIIFFRAKSGRTGQPG